LAFEDDEIFFSKSHDDTKRNENHISEVTVSKLDGDNIREARISGQVLISFTFPIVPKILLKKLSHTSWKSL